MRRPIRSANAQLHRSSLRGIPTAVAIFDTRAEKFVSEYKLPTPYSGPYRAAIDKNGEIWVAGMQTDRAIRLDPKTGETIKSPITGEPVHSKAFVEGLVLFDNVKLFGNDEKGRPIGGGLVQLFGDAPAGMPLVGEKKTGDFIQIAPDGGAIAEIVGVARAEIERHEVDRYVATIWSAREVGDLGLL